MKIQKIKQNRTVLYCPMTKETVKQAINKIEVSFGKPRKDGSVILTLQGLAKPLMEYFSQIAKNDGITKEELFRKAISKTVIRSTRKLVLTHVV